MLFYYQALAGDGKPVSGTIDAQTHALALRDLEQQGLVPIEIDTNELENRPWYLRDIAFVSHSFGDAIEANLANQLATLFNSKLPISDVLNIAQLSQQKPRIRTAIGKAIKGVEDGSPLWLAFDYSGTPFSREFINFLKVGDLSNNLPEALQASGTFFAKRAQSRSKVASALVYPAILICAGVGLLLVLGLFLIPTLMPLFKSAGIAPPVFFVFVEAIGNLLSTYGVLVLFLFVLSILFFLVWKRSETGRTAWQNTLSRVPKLGASLLETQLEQICTSAALLIQSGFTLPDSFKQIADTTPNTYLSNAFSTAAEDLKNGETALASLKKAKRLPSDFLAVVGLAEKTNRWPEVLSGFADALAQRNDETRTRFLTILTPAITVVIGLLAGTLIYTVMSALLEINAIATP